MFRKLFARWRWRLIAIRRQTQRLPYAARYAQLVMLKTHRELQRLLAAPPMQPGGEHSDREEAMRLLDDELEAEELRLVRTHLLYVEQETLAELRRYGMIDRATARRLARDVEAQLYLLKAPASRYRRASIQTGRLRLRRWRPRWKLMRFVLGRSERVSSLPNEEEVC